MATIPGTNGSETLNGDPIEASEDVLLGLGGNDVLNGKALNDTLIDDQGVNTFNGGTGFDVAQIDGTFAGATIVVTENTLPNEEDNDQTVIEITTSNGDKQTLAGIERVIFDDTIVNLAIEGEVSIAAALDNLTRVVNSVQQTADLILILEGNYEEEVVIDTAVDIRGQGVDKTVLTTGGTSIFTINSDLGANSTVSIDGIRFNSAQNSGINVDSGADLSLLEITNSSFTNNSFGGVVVDSGAGLDALQIVSTDFSKNGGLPGGGDAPVDNGDIVLPAFTGDLTLTNVNIDGYTQGEVTGGATPADFGLALGADGGVGDSLGSVTLNNVTITGVYDVEPVVFAGYDDLNGLSATNVSITAESNDDPDGSSATFSDFGGDFDLAGFDASTTSDGVFIGTDGADEANVLTGGASDDTIVGGAGDDTLRGNAGDDVLAGFDETGAGESDVDTALFSGAAADYMITDTTFNFGNGAIDGVQVVGPDGTDIVLQAEILDFETGPSVLLVGSGGFDTIQAAVAAASAGDIVRIAAGAYDDGVVVIDKQLDIVGVNEGASGAGLRSAESELLGAFDIQATGVTIDGVKVTDGATISGTPTAIRVGAAEATLSNLVIDRASATSTSIGVLAEASSGADFVLENSKITNFNIGASFVDGAEGAVTGNTFETNVVGVQSVGPDIDDISGNTFTDNSAAQIRLEGANGDAAVDVSAIIGANTITGSSTEVDIIGEGGVANQAVTGSDFDDVFTGTATGEIFEGGAGDDVADLGEGTDTAVFDGDQADFIITDDDDTGVVTVMDNRGLAATEGTDTLTGAENLQFNDGVVTVAQAANDAPVLATNDPLVLDEGGIERIGNSLLEFTDGDDAPTSLTYFITTAPTNGQLMRTSSFYDGGELTGDEIMLGAFSSFTQAQVNNGRIIYQHDDSETTEDSFEFTISDAAGASLSGTFDIDISLINDLPEFVSGSGGAFDENQLAVDTVEATDGDGNDILYAIAAGGDGELFEIDENTGVLTLKEAQDFENPGDANGDGTYVVNLTATDVDPITEDPISTTAQQNIYVLSNVNDFPPTIGTASFTAAENTTVAAALTVEDADGPATPDPVTWQITGGQDRPFFEIDPNSGVLSFVTAPDFENPQDRDRDNTYLVQVEATDENNASARRVVQVTVENVDDAAPNDLATEQADTITGTEVGEIIDGLGGDDILTGAGGDDILIGGAGRDQLFGRADDDTLYGGNKFDSLFGQRGDDTLFGGNFNDRLAGGDGDDLLVGEGGRDRLFGQKGVDTFLYNDEGRARDVIFDFEDGLETIQIDLNGVTQFSQLVEVVTSESDGDRTFTYTLGGDEILQVRNIDATVTTLEDDFVFI